MLHEVTWEPKKVIAVAVSAVIVVLVIAAFFILKPWQSTLANTSLPVKVADKVKSKAYLPTKLPGTYKIIEGSFSIQEEVLVFKATDGADGIIAFTEQPRPKNINFADWHKQQLTEPTTLGGVPYASVLGHSRDGKRWMLSIIADETWLLVSSSAPLNQQDFQLIASGIERAK